MKRINYERRFQAQEGVLSWKKVMTDINAEKGPHYLATNSGEWYMAISIPFAVLNPHRPASSYQPWDKTWSVVIYNPRTKERLASGHELKDFPTLQAAQAYCEKFFQERSKKMKKRIRYERRYITEATSLDDLYKAMKRASNEIYQSDEEDQEAMLDSIRRELEDLPSSMAKLKDWVETTVQAGSSFPTFNKWSQEWQKLAGSYDDQEELVDLVMSAFR